MTQPPDRFDVLTPASFLGLSVPDACLPGIAQNALLLRQHAAVLADFLAENAGED